MTRETDKRPVRSCRRAEVSPPRRRPGARSARRGTLGHDTADRSDRGKRVHMTSPVLISHVALWLVVLLLGFLLLGTLRALALLRWRLEQLEATTPRRVGRDGLPRGQKAPDYTLPSAEGPEVSLHD